MENNFSIFKYTVENTDIVSIIKNYIRLEKKGQNYVALCPFHSDKNPSLVVSPTKKIFKCFVCNESGNVIRFVEKFKKIPVREALQEIFKISNLDQSLIKKRFSTNTESEKFNKYYLMNNQAKDIYYRTLLQRDNIQIYNYLINRKISKEIIEEFSIGYAPISHNKKYLFSIMTNDNNMFGSDRSKELIWTAPDLIESNLCFIDSNSQYLDFFKNRIIIPIKDNFNNTVGFSGRTLDKKSEIKYLNSKNSDFFRKEEILFNFSNFDKSKYNEIFLVEGYFDLFSLKLLGINNIVALMGTNLTNKNLLNIKKYKNIESIILCLDNDDAGYVATQKLALQLINSNFNVYIVHPFKKNIKDCNDLINEYSLEECKKLINNQISYINYEIVKNTSNESSEKEINTLVKKLFNVISSFPLDYLYVDNDLHHISNFSKISFESLKEKFDLIKRNNTKNLQTNYTSEYKSKNYLPINLEVDEEIEFNKNKIFLKEDIVNEKLINQEKELIFLSINSTEILNIFFELYYVNTLIFLKKNNTDQIFINTIISYLKIFYNQKKPINYDIFLNYINENCLDKTFVNEFTERKNQIKKLNDKKLLLQQALDILENLIRKKFSMKKIYKDRLLIDEDFKTQEDFILKKISLYRK